jgi:hypothetical protein
MPRLGSMCGIIFFGLMVPHANSFGFSLHC